MTDDMRISLLHGVSCPGYRVECFAPNLMVDIIAEEDNRWSVDISALRREPTISTNTSFESAMDIVGLFFKHHPDFVADPHIIRSYSVYENMWMILHNTPSLLKKVKARGMQPPTYDDIRATAISFPPFEQSYDRFHKYGRAEFEDDMRDDATDGNSTNT